MKPEETIDFHIKYTWQNIARMYNELASGYGTTMATGYVLLNIDMEEGTPSTSLGPKMGMEATSLSRILKTMEEKDLIFRKKNPADGRSVLIFLTDFVIEFNKAVFSNISERKLEVFFEVINKVNELISNRKIYS
ncbi:MAG: MarR family winged helix-turn-helix transcriptional regulator [Owenweeksia sp.]